MTQITKEHLEFVQEAKEAFSKSSVLETYFSKDDYDLIALRFGEDRDCVMVYELGFDIANFTQQMDPKPNPRKEIMNFAHGMESQLEGSEYISRWSEKHRHDLSIKLKGNYDALHNALVAEQKNRKEITILCANIANFAMMIAHKEGDHL